MNTQPSTADGTGKTLPWVSLALPVLCAFNLDRADPTDKPWTNGSPGRGYRDRLSRYQLIEDHFQSMARLIRRRRTG